MKEHSKNKSQNSAKKSDRRVTTLGGVGFMEEKGYLPDEKDADYISDDPEDPRTLNDLEKENIDLKE